MTKNGSFKDYEIKVCDGAIELHRPKSSKQKALTYMLKDIHCVIRLAPNSVGLRPNENARSGVNPELQTTVDHCMNILSTNSRKRAIYFPSEAALKHWHAEVLSAQGFGNKTID